MPLEKHRELAIVREVAREIARGNDRAGDVALPYLQIPERKRGFGVNEEVGILRRGLTNHREGPLPVAATEHPSRAARHFRIHDVVDPRAGDARPDVLGVAKEHGVQGRARLPVLAPTGPVSKLSQLQPDVIQIELAEKKARGLVRGIGGETGARHFLSFRRIPEERRHQSRTGKTPRKRRIPVMAIAIMAIVERGLELEEQRGCAKLERCQIRRLPRAQLDRHRGRRVIAAVIEEALRVGECLMVERHQREVQERDQDPPRFSDDRTSTV